MSVELYLARRYLLDRRHGAWGWIISLIATGSVALGVATLITTLAIMTGFREDIREKMLGIHPHIFLTTFSGQFSPDQIIISNTLKANKEIKSWSPYVSGQILIGRGKNSSGATIKGINPEKETQVANLAHRLIQGSWKDLNPSIVEGEKPAIILGQELARQIGAHVGDVIWVVTPNSIGITATSVPQAHLFKVSGILNTGLYDYDTVLAYTHLHVAQSLFELGDHISGIGVRLNDPNNAELLAPKLRLELGGPFWVRSWISQNKNLFSALKLERMVMFTLLTLLTVVASFMIVSNLLLTITQKIKEIGILRAMGATSTTIRKIFLFQGLIMGLVGNLIGVALGLTLSFALGKSNLISLPSDVYYIDQLPIHIQATDVLFVVVVAAIIVLFASFYPAHKASKLDPLDAIRYG